MCGEVRVLKEEQREINPPLITEQVETCVFTLHEMKLSEIRLGHLIWVFQLSPQLLWISGSDPAVPQHL